MPTYHGTQAKLYLERILAETMILKEFIGTGDGVGDDTFYTANFPIVHDAGEAGKTGVAVAGGAAGVFDTDLTEVDDYWVGFTLRFTAGPQTGEMRVVTAYAQLDGEITVVPVFTGIPGNDAFILEPSVNVYTDETTPGTWHELEEDGAEYYITGATGVVLVLAAANNVDERYSIDYYYKSEVGIGQGVSIDFEGNLLDVHYIGSRGPAEIKSGVIAISGTISQLYCDRDLLGKFLGESDFYELPTDFSLYLYPTGSSAVGQPYIKVSKVKFGGGSLSVDVAGILATSVNYKGTVVAVGTV